jgi:putative ABC transport system substrate-binding protein
MALIGGAAAIAPLAALAQSGKLPVIGFLGAPSEAAWAPMVTAFEQRLQQLGWIDGRTVTILRRWAEGKRERFAEFASEFVQLKVDVIVTVGSAVEAVKRATSTIPVVFAIATDPVGSGFVDSLSRPGANVTGLSNQAVDIAGKRIEILRQIIPDLARIAVLTNAGYPGAVRELADVQVAARGFGLAVETIEIRTVADIAPAIRALKARTRVLYLCTDSLIISHVKDINSLAREAGVATMWSAREFCKEGGLISYGANEVDLFRRAGDYVDKILKGVKPADIPVEQPTAIDLVINLDTAKALDLEIPRNLLALANEVIE